MGNVSGHGHPAIVEPQTLAAFDPEATNESEEPSPDPRVIRATVPHASAQRTTPGHGHPARAVSLPLLARSDAGLPSDGSVANGHGHGHGLFALVSTENSPATPTTPGRRMSARTARRNTVFLTMNETAERSTEVEARTQSGHAGFATALVEEPEEHEGDRDD